MYVCAQSSIRIFYNVIIYIITMKLTFLFLLFFVCILYSQKFVWMVHLPKIKVPEHVTCVQLDTFPKGHSLLPNNSSTSKPSTSSSSAGGKTSSSSTSSTTSTTSTSSTRAKTSTRRPLVSRSSRNTTSAIPA